VSIQIRRQRHSTENVEVAQEAKLDWWRMLSMSADTEQAGFADMYWREVCKDFEKVNKYPS
jgi:hypothetical protein